MSSKPQKPTQLPREVKKGSSVTKFITIPKAPRKLRESKTKAINIEEAASTITGGIAKPEEKDKE